MIRILDYSLEEAPKGFLFEGERMKTLERRGLFQDKRQVAGPLDVAGYQSL